MDPQLYRPYGIGTSLYNIQWNLSYTDPMGPVLVCIIYPQLYRPYGNGTSLYKYVKQYILNGSKGFILFNA